MLGQPGTLPTLSTRSCRSCRSSLCRPVLPPVLASLGLSVYSRNDPCTWFRATPLPVLPSAGTGCTTVLVGGPRLFLRMERQCRASRDLY